MPNWVVKLAWLTLGIPVGMLWVLAVQGVLFADFDNGLLLLVVIHSFLLIAVGVLVWAYWKGKL